MILIEDAKKCCDAGMHSLRVEVAGHVMALVRGIFQPPETRQAAVGLRLIPSAGLTRGIVEGLVSWESLLPAASPLRVITPLLDPTALGMPQVEFTVPTDPTFDTFDEALFATLELAHRLVRRQTKTCMEGHGLNPNNPRKWKPGGHQSRA